MQLRSVCYGDSATVTLVTKSYLEHMPLSLEPGSPLRAQLINSYLKYSYYTPQGTIV